MENQNNKKQEQLAAFNNVVGIHHETIAENVLSAVREGEVNPITTHLSLKRMEKLVETLKKSEEFQDFVLEAAKNNLEGNEKNFKQQGAKISVAATYTWYDFSDCNCPLYTQLCEIEETIKEAKKQREVELKLLIPAAGSLILSKKTEIIEKLPVLELIDHGEEIQINPPIKKQKTGVKVAFDKPLSTNNI